MIYLSTFSYNVGVAKIFGVCSSVFLKFLSDEYQYQYSHKLLNNNNTLSVNRQDIYDRTGLDDEKQKEVEMALAECGVLCVKPVQNVPDKNYYIVDDEQLDKIVKAPRPEEVISEAVALQFLQRPRKTTVSKRQTTISKLKTYIKAQDPIIRQYMCDWVDAVYSNPRGFLSQSSLRIAEDELMQYTKGDVDKQIELLKIAIKNGMRDISWAIEAYEKRMKGTNTNNFVTYSDIASDGTNTINEGF